MSSSSNNRYNAVRLEHQENEKEIVKNENLHVCSELLLLLKLWLLAAIV